MTSRPRGPYGPGGGGPGATETRDEMTDALCIHEMAPGACGLRSPRDTRAGERVSLREAESRYR